MAIACYAHPTMPTVADCADCSRGLCATCEPLVRPPLCVDCADARAKLVIDGAYRRFIGFCIWGLVGVALGIAIDRIRLPHALFGFALPTLVLPPHAELWVPIALGYVFGGAIYGRHAIEHRGGRRGFIMTLDLMLTLGVIMIVIGAVIGIVATPFGMLADYRLVRRQRILSAAVRRSVLGTTTPARIISARIR